MWRVRIAQLAALLDMPEMYNATREAEWNAAMERRQELQEAMGRPVPVLVRRRPRLPLSLGGGACGGEAWRGGVEGRRGR
jgi:hypothetical protein